ncbi:MAG: AlpA family transcriptional regulator [Dehalococcoidia bacterium]|nr:AlpA family transcriptional regulator [Dehalococcoidia bacterium]
MKVLRLPAVLARVGISRSTLWRLIQANSFPKPIRLGGRSVGWIEAEIDDWILSRARAEGNGK